MGSKDLDFRLVSNKNLSKILACSDWAQVTWAKVAKNLPHLWRHSQKTQNQKCFFNLQTIRLAKSFEGLDSSLA